MPYIPPEVVEQARQIDLLTYLQSCEPQELVRISGNNYTTRTHDSLKISNGKWMWWSQRIGGCNALDYMPFEDAVAIVCHEEGKLIGLPPNRAIYAEPETVELTYSELADRFRNAESEGKKHLTGYIIFSQESFNKPYDEKSRTYAVSSDNKAFKAGLGGYSIYGSCLDGSDPCVRLDGYMRGENAWKIEKCYLKEASREMLDIICGKFFICHAPYEAERFQSLPPDLAEKYREKFQYPERFARINDKIVAVPFKPAKADRER